MFKFLHAADIHLDSPLVKLDYYEGAPVEEMRGATRRAFENLIDLAILEEVAFVLLAGDLYDGAWRDYNTGLYLVSQMSRLREADIQVYIIGGNHDAASKITKILRLPDGVYMFPAEKAITHTISEIGVAVHGQSFPSPAVRKNLSAKYPEPVAGCFNIGMLHTCATGREGHEPYAPCTLDGLRSKGYDYWALGHVHRREVLLDDPLILFPGNIQGRHIRETGPKGCLLVTVDDRGRAKADFRTVDVIRWARIEVDASRVRTGYEVVDLVEGRFIELNENNEGLPMVARVEVSGITRAHDEILSDPERWTMEVKSLGVDISAGRVWIEKVKFRTEAPSKREAIESEGGPISELNRYLDAVRSDPEQLKVIAESMEDLKKKIPRELREGVDAIALDSPNWLADILEQVRPMLLRRLMTKEEFK